MKLPPIPGKVFKVGKILTVNKGFKQTVIIHQLERKNNVGQLMNREQFFVVNTWSNKENDSRFLKPERVGTDCIAELYLDGQRWMGKREFEYNHKLNLDKWIE